jgi:hypothetical protein
MGGPCPNEAPEAPAMRGAPETGRRHGIDERRNKRRHLGADWRG